MKSRKASSTIVAAPPSNAASRSQPGQFNVLMIERSSQTSFMPNAAVFPGGSLENSESKAYLSSSRCHNAADVINHIKSQASSNPCEVNSLNASQQLVEEKVPDIVAFRIAALRELFEETGFLFARRCVPNQPSNIGIDSRGPGATPSPTAGLHPQQHIAPLSLAHSKTAAHIDIDYHLHILLDELDKTPPPDGSGADDAVSSRGLIQRNVALLTQYSEALARLSKEQGVPVHEAVRRIIHSDNPQELLAMLAKNRDAKSNGDLDHDRALESHNFVQLLEMLHLDLPIESIMPLSKWITPLDYPKRFDTNFYLALFDDMHQGDHNVSSAGTLDGDSGAEASQSQAYDRLMQRWLRDYHDRFALPSIDTQPQEGERPALVPPAQATESSLGYLTSTYKRFSIEQPAPQAPSPSGTGQPGQTQHPAKQSPAPPVTNTNTSTSSTLQNELSNVWWRTPMDILRLATTNEVVMTPPTVYLLSQLASLSFDDLRDYTRDMQTTLGRVHSTPRDDGVHHGLHHTHASSSASSSSSPLGLTIPVLPVRNMAISTDPYTFSIRSKQLTELSNNGKPLSLKRGKFHGLLPGDYENPLTHTLLLRLMDAFYDEYKQHGAIITQSAPGHCSSSRSSQLMTESTDNAWKIAMDDDEYLAFHNTATFSDHFLSSLKSPSDIIHVFQRFAPHIPLSFVQHVPSPLDFRSTLQGQHPGITTNEQGVAYYHQLQQHLGLKLPSNPVEPTAADDVDFSARPSLELFSKLLALPSEVQRAVKPFIHYHRVTDAIVHKSFVVVVSNQSYIRYLHNSGNGEGCPPTPHGAQTFDAQQAQQWGEHSGVNLSGHSNQNAKL